MRVACQIVACLALTACQTEQAALKERMDTWIGRPIAEYAIRNGTPASTFPVGTAKMAFEWRFTSQTPGLAVPFNGMMIYRAPEQTLCRTVLVASTTKAHPTPADWIIESWHYSGC